MSELSERQRRLLEDYLADVDDEDAITATESPQALSDDEAPKKRSGEWSFDL